MRAGAIALQWACAVAASLVLCSHLPTQWLPGAHVSQPTCVVHPASLGSSCCSATEDQWLLYDGMRAQLLDPEFANDTVHFMELQVGRFCAFIQFVFALFVEWIGDI